MNQRIRRIALTSLITATFVFVFLTHAAAGSASGALQGSQSITAVGLHATSPVAVVRGPASSRSWMHLTVSIPHAAAPKPVVKKAAKKVVAKPVVKPAAPVAPPATSAPVRTYAPPAPVVTAPPATYPPATAPPATNPPPPPAPSGGNADQMTALRLMNADRAAHGLAASSWRSDLQAKAQAWAEHLATPGVPFAHSPSLATGITQCWAGLAENIAANYSLSGAETSFMLSPEHRASILNSAYNFAAVGVARTSDGRVFVVQEFAQGC